MTLVLIAGTYDLDEYLYDAMAAGASGFLREDVRDYLLGSRPDAAWSSRSSGAYREPTGRSSSRTHVNRIFAELELSSRAGR